MLLFNHDIFLLTKVYILHIMESVRENLIFEIGLLFFLRDERRLKMKLRDLASVRSGLVLSRKQSKEPTNDRYPLINLRCIQQEGIIDLTRQTSTRQKSRLKDEYLSQRGDIVVRLTAPGTAVLIDDTTAGMVISSNFVVIRTEDGLLLPEYLFWLLNTQNSESGKFTKTRPATCSAPSKRHFRRTLS